MLIPLMNPVGAFPTPPEHILTHRTSHIGQVIMEIAIAGGLFAALAGALWLRRRYDTWVPAAITVGAMMSALVEPLPDAVANLWYYSPGQDALYTSYGNSLPIWTFFSYTMYYGGIGMVFWWLVERGATRRRLAIICIPVAIYLAGGELLMINVLHLYTYHGPAALVIGHYPAWICLMNTSIVVPIGILGARIRRSMSARDQLLPAFLLPSVMMAVGLLVVPMVLWSVIHSTNPSQGLVDVATAITILMALAVINAAMKLMPAEGFESIDAEAADAPVLQAAMS